MYKKKKKLVKNLLKNSDVSSLVKRFLYYYRVTNYKCITPTEDIWVNGIAYPKHSGYCQIILEGVIRRNIKNEKEKKVNR